MAEINFKTKEEIEAEKQKEKEEMKLNDPLNYILDLDYRLSMIELGL